MIEILEYPKWFLPEIEMRNGGFIENLPDDFRFKIPGKVEFLPIKIRDKDNVLSFENRIDSIIVKFRETKFEFKNCMLDSINDYGKYMRYEELVMHK